MEPNEVRITGPAARDEGLRKREELVSRVENALQEDSDSSFAIVKGNPYHDKSGRFTTGRGGGKAGGVRKGKNRVWEAQRKARKAEEAAQAATKAAEAAAVETAKAAAAAAVTTPKPKAAPKPKPVATTTTTTSPPPPVSLLAEAESLIGQPAGNINSDGKFWCADFISYLTGNPLGGDPGPQDVRFAFPPTTAPQPGDAVLIDLLYGTDVGHDPTMPSHVAIISRITDTHVEVIEGNGASSTHIAINSYPIGAVTSYAELPRKK